MSNNAANTWNRRDFLKTATGATCVTTAGVLGYTWRVEPHWVETVRRELPIAHLPQALIGRTLVHISDLHVGPYVDDGYITNAISKVSSFNPDIVAITGDFMTYRTAEHIDQTARILESLPRGRLTTVGVLGNHDYGVEWLPPSDAVADRLTARLRALGINILRNGHENVMGLQVVGVDDLWGPHFDPRAALAKLPARCAKLALCHNPDAADRPLWSGYRGWILCGHTHGGQCKSPFFRAPVLPVNNKRYTAGEIDLYDGRRLYINRGLGYRHRVRFNARPEITVFTLTRTAVT